MASSCRREIEHRSASACKYESSTVLISDDGWKIAAAEDDVSSSTADDAAGGAGGSNFVVEGEDAHGNKRVKCQTLAPGTSIRISPMARACGGWSSEHFHEHLRLPAGAAAGRGVIVLFEAMGRECVAVALAPYHDFELGKTYAVHFGANGNLQTVLRRHVNATECVDTTVPSRVCAEDAWIPYWICLQGGKLSAGVGRVPGRRCVGTLDDGMYHMLRSGVDAARYVGIGNSALQRNARDLRVRGLAVLPIPPHFGAEGVPVEEDGGAFVNVRDAGHGVAGHGRDGGRDGAAGVPTDAELLAEYERERAKARARAEKFGVAYKEPPPAAFLRWSEARRLRANPERGFVTGIDTFSEAERAKADARRERFAREERKRKEADGDDDDRGDGRNEEAEAGEAMEDEGVDDVAEWEKTKRDPLPVEQAWENWKLVEQFRVDPPASSSDAAREEGEEEATEFIPKHVAIVPTKVHVFSIDWAPFKQLRSDDIMSYFRDYGPSYVEWLGELTCNVLFEDKHSAARALHALSQELPPPPKSLTDDPSSAPGEAGESEEVTIMENTQDDGDGVDGGAEKNSMDATNNGDEGAEDRSVNGTSKQDQEEEPLPDFGRRGWRFCKWTLRKVSNDRYGRRGTRARVLMRLATSTDILDDKPTEWPKPPPGFTTQRVLMPWHDFSGKRRRQPPRGGQGGRRDTKRRRRGDGSSDRRGGRIRDDEYTGEGEHPGDRKSVV